MGKRRINKQQSARIEKIQAKFRHSVTNQDSMQEEGLVISRFSRHAEVESLQGKRINCAIRPNIESFVAGDRVIWQAVENEGVIVSRYPRESVLQRSDRRHEFKPVAANISQLLVVVALEPELSWYLLDSYAVMAENLHLKLTIVFNKIDLPCETLKQRLIACYQSLGYQVIGTSNINHVGYDTLEEILKGHVSVFVGQSGVGKSSLIAGLLPATVDVPVGAISATSKLGCHTTSNSRLYHLPSGGQLIDSPGVREFALGQVDNAALIQGFREFRRFVSHCQYRNCDHQTSPNCALVAALHEQKITQSRYDSFIKLKTQLKLI